MADTKISALTGATTPLAGTEVVPIVQSSTTKNVSVANLTAGRNVSCADLTTTGNTILGDATTDNVRVNGYMGVGGAASGGISVYARNTALTGTSQVGFQSQITATSASTTGVYGLYIANSTEAAAFTVGNAYGVRVANLSLGAGSSATNQHGLHIADLTSATNNYGITSLVSSGTNKWNLYASGTANNYMAGNLAFASGKGIDFSATGQAAGMTSELLADYEEGTWTPVIADASTGGNLGSATVTFATYTKIGRQVTVSATLTNIVTAGMTAANVFYVRGLPFTSGSQQSTGVVRSDAVTFQSSTTYMTANISTIDSWMTFFASGSGIADVQVDCGDFSTGVSDLIFTITYFTA